jgi:hypothetical protein
MKQKISKWLLVLSLTIGVFSSYAFIFNSEVHASTIGDTIVSKALTQLGEDYVWGGSTPGVGFDCSGLVYWAHREAGATFNDKAIGRTTASVYSTMGVAVAYSDLQPGDVVTFKTDPATPNTVTHIGIYMGNGNMVHAPTFGMNVQIENINNSYWQTKYYNARRLYNNGLPSIPVLDVVTQYGNIGDQPIIGDWDGDGKDDIGVYQPNTATFVQRTGTTDYDIQYGNIGDQPIIGDWDGNGKDDIGIYRPNAATFVVRIGTMDYDTQYGNIGDQPIIGDWDGNGKDNLGIYRLNNATFVIRF